MKTANARSCEEVRLDIVLSGDEDSAEFRASASHVESCPHCQRSLTQLAAAEGDWAAVREILHALDAGDGQSMSHSAAAEHMKLDFLAPASHPEMLGRLGRYEIEAVIGIGGMGIVLKGFDSELNRPVAIKVLAPHLAHRGTARQRFAREARAAAAVVHEHVVAIHNVESEHATPFLVMQYVPGRSLQDRVDQEGPLDATEILRIGMQAAAGLAAAHAQGVIHRDVKPANILLENSVDRALLTDFGLARAAHDLSLTHSGVVAGTPHYMSPEQASGEVTDARSDLFSLGAVLYFMAAGHPPFRAERPIAVLNRIRCDRHRPVWEISSSIPDEIGDLIDRLLEKKPSRRFASAAETQEALSLALSGIQQRGPRAGRRWFRRMRKSGWWFAGAVAATVAATAIISVAAWIRFIEFGADRNMKVTSQRAALVNGPVEVDGASTSLDLVAELAAIDRALNQFESSPLPETIVLRSLGDAWVTGLKEAGNDVTRLEASLLEGWPD
jgi:hypothetical protein